jgi:cbb3-type cytochrome oxidase subunit 3
MNTTTLGVTVTVCFFIAFVAIAVWAYLPGNKDRLKSYGQIPLEEDHEHEQ